MQSFFGIVYLIFFLGCIIASLFILFHLLRYALDRQMALIMGLVFASVVLVLLITNTILFFSIPFDALLPTTPTGVPSLFSL